MKTNEHDSVFQNQIFTPNGSSFFADCQSLTKREYFAAMAMQGLLANWADNDVSFNLTPARAVQFADELIEALNK